MGYTRVVIIGGGFAGLNVAKALRKAKMDLILVDKSNHHLFQPLLYQVATAALSPAEIAYPIREIFRGQPNTMIVMGEVASINKEQKHITLRNGDTIGYDYLIIASGASHSYFGNDSWETWAPGLKTISDALTIREKILLSFEIAERLNNVTDAEKYLNFIVIGGGPTGVEMAGAIAEITKTTMLENFRRIRPEKSKVFLLEALPHILPSYSKKLSKEAQKDLEALGVHVITGKKVININDKGVQTEDLFIESKNIIWAAGNQASPLVTTLNIPLDKQGRAIVEPDLSIPGHSDIFVIGDVAHTKSKEGPPLPSIAPVAIQQGKYIAKLLKNIGKERKKPFRYHDKGSMATIGKGKAIAKIGKIEFGGLLAWLAWGLIHIFYLIGFRNRLRVTLEWIVVFATGQRGVRVIRGSVDPYLQKKES